VVTGRKINGSDAELGVLAETNFFLGTTADGSCIKLNEGFVMDNFPLGFIQAVKKRGREKKVNFIRVPPGAPRTEDGVHDMIDDNMPRMEYLQEGDYTCLFCSFASALHYVGLTDLAKLFKEESSKYSSFTEDGAMNWSALVELVRIGKCAWLVPHHMKDGLYDIYNNTSEWITVAQLQAVDGSVAHAVTIVGNLVFDSNVARAMSLCQKTLDYCCSTDTKMGKFQKVRYAVRFIEDAKTRKPRWPKLKKNI
jgi:hypothetical protein